MEDSSKNTGKEELFSRALKEGIRKSDEVEKKREIEGNSSRYQLNA